MQNKPIDRRNLIVISNQ